MLFSLLAALLAAPGPNLLANGDFAGDLDTWEAHVTAPVLVTVADGALRITVPSDAPVAWPLVNQRAAAAPGDIVALTWTGRGLTTGGHGGYASIDFLDGKGHRISYSQGPPAPANGGPATAFTHRAVAPPGTAALSVSLVLHGHGTAWFDDVALVKIGDVPQGAVSELTLTTAADPLRVPFRGFGFEDDGWDYNSENAALGVDAADLALREKRIEWMEPDLVRMFFWIADWCPSGDWKTFTFDTDNMASHYRSLDVYQRLGTPVIVCGVEWGIDKPWRNPVAAGEGIAALLRHLVVDKGYTCIQGWMLSNEPDISFIRQGGSFDEFVTVHQTVRDACARENLAIEIYGSDDALGLPWFEQCITTPAYADVVDAWSSHRYFPGADRYTAPWFFEERLDLIQAHTRGKPFLVTEFGFQDSASSHLDNPLMRQWDYGLHALDFAFTGLNAGASGFSIWCLHETMYPGGTHMKYGLWDGKENDWALRPVYHGWAMLTRLTKRGDPVRPVTSTAAHAVRAVQIGERLFWVNQQDAAVTVTVAGFAPGSGRVYTEDAVTDGDDRSVALTPNGNTFTAPPRSFGYLESAAG